MDEFKKISLIKSKQMLSWINHCLRYCFILLLLLLVPASCNKNDIENPDYYGNEAGEDEIPPDSPDLPGVPPDTKQIAALSNRMVQITFTEAVNAEIAVDKYNYIINGLSVVEAEMDPEDPAIVNLTTVSQNPVDYSLLILNIEDLEGNKIRAAGYFREFQGLAPADASLAWMDPDNPANAILTPKISPAYNKSSIYVNVTGADIAAYKYKVDDNEWSDEIPVAQPINVSGLPEGAHAIVVIGKHALNYWQETEAATGVSWMQDTLPPTAGFLETTLPANPTSSQGINVQVIGQDVDSYYYCMDLDCDSYTWTGPVSRSNSINIPSLAPGDHRISVRGLDRAGNAQDEDSPTSYEWSIDLGESTAILDSDSLPPSFSNTSTVSIYVENTNGIVGYKAKIVTGTDCGTDWADGEPERDVSDPITVDFPDLNSSPLTGDPSQEYTVCVVGVDVFGNWQDDSAVTAQTRYTWTVDTGEPTAGINWINPYSPPSGTISQTSFEVEVFGDDVRSYRYALLPTNGTACSSATYSAEVSDLNTHIFLNSLSGSPQTAYTLCVAGKDSADNWQAAADATSHSWTIDLVPPASNPAFTAPAVFTGLAIQFQWSGQTADTKAYQIQIAVDPAFGAGDILLDQEIGNVTSFTYAVNPNDGPSYYARLKAIDEIGNKIASWSAVSAEHMVVGNIKGSVEDNAGSPVSGILVELLDKNNVDLGAAYADQTTALLTGEFEFQNVRIGKLAYKVRVAADDATYFEARKSNISVTAGDDTQTGTITIVLETGASAQTVSGKVVDGDDGWMLGYAEVKLVQADGTVYATTRADFTDCDNPAPILDLGVPTNLPKRKFDDGGTCGDFEFLNVPAGTHTLVITGDSWGTSNKMYNDMELGNIAVFDSTLNKGRIPLVALISGQDIKFVLQWGTLHPVDLDFHVVGTLPSGEVLVSPNDDLNGDDCDDTLFHAWAARPNVGLDWQQQFSAKNNEYPQGAAAYSGENYFPKNPLTTTALTQDANSGYGPEAVNFYSGYKDGTYWFTVVNWSEWYPGSYGTSKVAEQWDVTNASIQAYDADGLLFEIFAVPPSGQEQYELWQAFKMNVSGNGPSARQFEAVNSYVNWPDASGYNVLDSDKCELSGF